MVKKEAQQTTKFLNYLKKYNIRLQGDDTIPCLFEIKVVRSYTFNPDRLSDKQKRLLGATRFIHKFTDAGMTGTPCDAIFAPRICGYLVLWWDVPRNNEFIIIHNTMIPDKRITIEQARELATLIINI